MVDVEGGNNMLYLPLDKIVNSSSGGSLPLGVSSGSGASITPSDRDIIVNQVVEQLRREISNSPRRREGR